MGKHYTTDQIDMANKVDLLSYVNLKGYELIPSGSTYRMIDHKSLAINPKDNVWFRQCTEVVGGMIKFFINI